MLSSIERELIKGLGEDLPHYRTPQDPVELNRRLLADIESRKNWNRSRGEVIVFKPLITEKTA